MANCPKTDSAIDEHKDTDSTVVGRKSSDGNTPLLSHIRSRTSGVVSHKRSSDHSAQILAGLNELRQTGQFCDVTLKAGSKTIFAHRVVLASSSHYFNAMFSHPVLESYSECVTIQDVDEAALVHIVEFIYTGDLLVNEETVETLLPASNLLQLPFVRDACCQFLQSQLQPENCLGILRFAKFHNCNDLWETTRHFAEDNFAKVASSCDEFAELSTTELEQLISSDRLIASEGQVLEAVRRWVGHDLGKRQKAAKRLFERVRFGLLSRDEIVRLGRSAEFLSSNPWCKDLLLQAAIYHLSTSNGEELMALEQFRHRRSTSEVLMVIAGFLDSDLASVETFDFRTGLWTTVPDDETVVQSNTSLFPAVPDIPRARSFCGVAVLQRQVYVIGGCINGNAIRFVDIYDTVENSWIRGPELRRKRDEVGVAVLGQKIYAIGGFDGSKALYSAEVLDVESGTWRSIASMSCARRRLGVACLDDKIFAVGGELDDQILCSAEYYDPSTNMWTSIADMEMVRRLPAVCGLGSRLYVIGGEDAEESYLTSVEYYSPETDTWYTVSDMNEARSASGAVAYGGLLYVVGGENDIVCLSSMETYDPQTDTWTVCSQEMKSARSGAGVAIVELPTNSI
ncbi:hypothetical protein CRM22_011262 [Opisthorchis felineus]|uniref:BTB domain-containing protein n=1 Tax=Opisthorchis felineus TaxID=147828 RepID=A0A4S2JS18_OPIFE|nr:hypothetical protein CRM22_011262 [Opisthorchis felineus]